MIENWHGVEFEPALRRQRETIEIVRQVLSGEEISYDGKLFDLEHFRLRSGPPRANLRIYVAVQGETNVELAGSVMDGCPTGSRCRRSPVSASTSIERLILMDIST